jgi:hypothetical protein
MFDLPPLSSQSVTDKGVGTASFNVYRDGELILERKYEFVADYACKKLLGNYAPSSCVEMVEIENSPKCYGLPLGNTPVFRLVLYFFPW